MYELGYDGDGEEVYYHMEYASLEEAIKSLDTEVTEKVVWESIK